MENSGIKKYFGITIFMYSVWAGMYAGIIALLAMMNAADVEMGIYQSVFDDEGAIIGISLSSILGFGVGGLGIMLSIVGLTTGEKKPGMAKSFCIANFVFIAACLGTIALMVVMGAPFMENSVECAQSNPLAEWRAHCAVDVSYNNMIIISWAVISVFCIAGIASSARIVGIIRKTVLHTGSGLGSTSLQQSVAATGSQRKPCMACGTPNEPDAEFCKKCGKAC